MKAQTIDLEQLAGAYGEAAGKLSRRVIVCAGTGCVANGSLAVHAAIARLAEERGLNVTTELRYEDDYGTDPVLVSKSGCHGFCQVGPLVIVEPDGIIYVRVKPEDALEIAEKTLVNGQVVERLLYTDPLTQNHCRGAQDIPFYRQQTRTVLSECGHIDPENISEYIHRGGYAAARRAYVEMTPETVCEEVTLSGLRGRGGGGFPTGRKWALTLKQANRDKFVICNGDEGDPGAFMDRSVMEGNPHSVVEGMMIAARAVGAETGYVYVRAEYPLAVKRIRKAVADAEQAGLLGERLFGTMARFRINVMEGAGAFVCGEETALIASIEGKRGMPAPKPPFPAQSGLFGKPTVINNVETLATVPLVISRGARAFASVGTKSSPGTKTFALTGHVANTGLIEVPFGTTLREIVFDIGGGVTHDDGRLWPDGFKAVQIGGPSGGCLTEAHLDLPLDFDSLREVGAMVGSGGLVVMNKHTCMPAIARFFMQFTQQESCGKCVLCREGTKQMLALLDDILEGRATAETLDLLMKLASAVRQGSLCGLGKTAPSPVLSTMRYFRAEYDAHVFQKKCPAHRCKALLDITIDPVLCKGCGRCLPQCPVGAIAGKPKSPYAINPELCIKCGACMDVCKFKAIARS